MVDNRFYMLPVEGGELTEIRDVYKYLPEGLRSPDGRYELCFKRTPVEEVKSSEIYPDLDKSDAYIFTTQSVRNWDHWRDGSYYHVYYKNLKTKDSVDIIGGKPFQVASDLDETETVTWGPESHHIYYVADKQKGASFLLKVDPDIYKYDSRTRKTENMTRSNNGFDSGPRFSAKGVLAYLQGEAPGYFQSKRDIIVLHNDVKINLTDHWDGKVKDFIWAKSGDKLYFTANINGTIQVFQVNDQSLWTINPL